MLEFLQTVFADGLFIPHGHCYLWQPGLVWLHIISDALIAIDNGCGMTEKVKQKIFDPFFTTKPVGSGYLHIEYGNQFYTSF